MGGCMAFTQRSDVNIQIKSPVALDFITPAMFESYLNFLSDLHPDYAGMLDGEAPTLKSPTISLNFGHALINYQIQVLWRYLWAAPWNVGVITYLFENGFTPAECLLILGLKMPYAPINTTPYHIINNQCLVSTGIVIPLLESLGEVSPDTYTINSKFIHAKDNGWIQSTKDSEERTRRLNSLTLKKFSKLGLLSEENFFEDLENLDNVRAWVAQFK